MPPVRARGTLMIIIRAYFTEPNESQSIKNTMTKTIGTIITKRESVASTADGASAVGVQIIDDGGLSGTGTSIYNDFAPISIHSNGYDVNLLSTGAEIDITAPTVDINASSTIALNSAAINSSGAIKSGGTGSTSLRWKEFNGTLAPAGSVVNIAMGIARTSVRLVSIVTRVAGDTYLAHVRHNTPLNLAEFTHSMTTSDQLQIFTGVNQLNLSNQAFRATIFYV